MDEEFDLLAGHDLGESRAFGSKGSIVEEVKILVWHKLETCGYQPAAREGHTAVTNGLNVFVFGGMQTGMRTNTVLSLDVTSGSWNTVQCSGDLPPPRSHHAACTFGKFMLVHGGESLADVQFKATAVPSETVNTDTASPNVSVINPGLSHVGSLSITIDSEWTSGNHAAAHLNDGLAMEGVCPGDMLGEKRNVSANLGQGNGDAARLVCLDDFHLLDTLTNEWFKVGCVLAPLPRKGHSMVVANIDHTPHVVIFGGFASGNLTLSNSVQVCEVSSIIQHHKDLLASRTATQSLSVRSSSGNHVVSKVKSLRLTQQTHHKTGDQNSKVNPIVFRTLNCRGVLPPPRYRHSCSVVRDESRGEDLMVVVGGVGKDTASALSDVHILNLGALEWMALPDGSNALAQGLGGDGPASGIYGHSSFPVVAEKLAGTGAECQGVGMELLVYGGSSNAASAKSNCHRHIYAFHLDTYRWRKVSTGFSFPAARNNHSATIVPGWAPSNNIPQSAAVKAAHTIRTKQEPTLQSGVNSVVVFGGINAVMCAADTWALDLQWRPPGVEQYDSNAAQLISEELAEQNIVHSASNVELQLLQSTGLMPSATKRGVMTGTFTLNSQGVATLEAPKIHAHNDEKYFNLIRNKSGGALPPGNKTPFSRPETLRGSAELKTSASEPQFFAPQMSRSFDQAAASAHQLLGGSSHGLTSGSQRPSDEVPDKDIGHAFMKVRRERAQSDLQFKREVQRAELAESEAQLLLTQIENLESLLLVQKAKNDSEVADLRGQLERSLARERQLQTLNEEAYKLLVLHGINNL